jgi:aspartyl aminopeptidase
MPVADRAETADFLAFLDACPTPYHAAREVAGRLAAAGFSELGEEAPWALQPGQRAFILRGGSLLAFVTGTEPPWESGFVALGAHTDSPNLRLKPSPELSNVGYRQAAIEVYGGALLSTWLDRDLALAGRVALTGGRSELVRVPGAPFRIPNVAIHLNREVNKDGLVVNPQTQLTPLWALEQSVGKNQALELVVETLAGTACAGATLTDIVGFDLCLFDAQGAALGGANGELVCSARLDNLGSCYPIARALVAAGPAGRATRVIALHDHEEVGSQSASGARSRLLESLLERLTLGHPGAPADALPRALARSLFVSADMAHAVHPNYADKHDKLHRPLLGSGPVVKVNANQSYATDGIAQGAFVEACRAEGVTPQLFVSRNDQPCGSTIGPITAARLGIRSIDIGSPMLAMHSCRETAGSADAPVMERVLTRILREPPNPHSRA